MPTTDCEVLKRFGHKGQFVRFPKEWGRRMVHTGLNRYDTSCDLIVGQCACGERHEGTERWMQEYLESYNQRIETHEEWMARTQKNG